MEQISEQLGVFGPLIVRAVQALIFLIVGWIVASALSAFVRSRVTSNPRVDETLGSFAAGIVKWLVMAAVFIAVLQIFGFEATSLVAILGAATLAIGLALQGTFADIAAGVMIIIFRPFKLGQYVDIGGTAGTVKDVNLFLTELVTPDNVQIIIPNGQAWGRIVTNYSHHSTRRLDLNFGIDYSDDMDKAMKLILDLAAADDRVHKDPEPWVRIVGLGDSSVDIGARLWCDADDYWELKWEMTKKVKEAFDANGVTIPFPHTVEIQKSA